MLFYRFGLESYIDDLSGYGAKLYGGRWNNIGNSMLYTSCSPSLAMLEFVCNASGIAKTKQTSLITLNYTFNSKFDELKTNDLPENWRDIPSPDVLKLIGDNWLNRKKSIALKVPSAIMPIEFNYLFNPIHSDFAKLKIDSIVQMELDNRIIK